MPGTKGALCKCRNKNKIEDTWSFIEGVGELCARLGVLLPEDETLPVLMSPQCLPYMGCSSSLSKHAPLPSPGEFSFIPPGTPDALGPAWIFPKQPLTFPDTVSHRPPPGRPLSHTGPSHTPRQPDTWQLQPSGGSGTNDSHAPPRFILFPKSILSANPVGSAFGRSRSQPFLLILPSICCLDQGRRLLTGACFCP